MISALDLICEPLALDNRHFKVDSAKLYDVIDLQIVVLVPCFEPFQDVVARFFVSNNVPHRLGQIDIIFKFDFLIQLCLWEVVEIVFLSQLLLFGETLFLLGSDLFVFFWVNVYGWHAQIVVYCNLVI